MLSYYIIYLNRIPRDIFESCIPPLIIHVVIIIFYRYVIEREQKRTKIKKKKVSVKQTKYRSYILDDCSNLALEGNELYYCYYYLMNTSERRISPKAGCPVIYLNPKNEYKI